MQPTNPETFTAWLTGRLQANSDIGDLARDLEQAGQLEQPGASYSEIKEHLTELHACDAALTALDKAYMHYLRALPMLHLVPP